MSRFRNVIVVLFGTFLIFKKVAHVTGGIIN